MHVERVHPARVGERRLDVAVVIDVLRATSTAVVLAGRGVERLLVLASADDLHQLPPIEDGWEYLLFSEFSKIETTWPRVDNSPAVALKVDLTKKIPVLITTNGTRATRVAVSQA